MNSNIKFCRECGTRIDNEAEGCGQCNKKNMSFSLRIVDVATKNPRITIKVISVAGILAGILLIYLLESR